jgi:hypothetical protein
MTADKRNAVDCNEAMLVDSMVPLDKVMVSKEVHVTLPEAKWP